MPAATREATVLALDAKGRAAARAAGLRYVQPGVDAGFGRKRVGKRAFTYLDARGRRVRDAAAIERFRSLAIPPAWTSVWICADARGHIQATGRDARGRLQYRYHAAWRARRDGDKFGLLADFCRAMPALRKRIARDLACDCLCRDTVSAAVVALIERGHLRVGNAEYARANGSYGATTLERRHLRLHGDELELHYRGKSGIDRRVHIADGTLAEVLRRVRRLPGDRLFQYQDGARVQAVRSSDVNRYLRAVMGGRFSAKYFRTWAATLSAAMRLAQLEAPTSATAAKRAANGVIKEVAERLGHTPAVCRASYIHPGVLRAFADGTLAPHFPDAIRASRALEAGRGRVSAERALIRFLESAPPAERAAIAA